VIAPLEAEVALTVKGAAPNVFVGIAVKVKVVASPATVKLVEAVVAA
jgi:hypothetical protein